MRSLATLLVLALILFAPVLTTPVHAGGLATPWQDGHSFKTRMIFGAMPGNDGGKRLVAGLEIVLEPGWKTYWRNPGESGAPPQVDWSGSTNTGDVTLQWPAPKRFSAFGFDSFGYADRVILPLVVRPVDATAPMQLRARVSYLICADICVPADATLALDLPVGTAAATPHRPSIAAAQQRVPRTGTDAPAMIVGARVITGTDRANLELTMRSRVAVREPDVMVEGPMPFSFGRPQVALAADRHGATLRLPIYGDGDTGKLAGKAIVVTLVDDDVAVESRVTIAP